MAYEQSWEVVGKTKKAKGNPKKLSAAKEKEMLDKMPRIENVDPVPLDDTMYSVFEDREREKQRAKEKAAAAKAEALQNQNGNKKAPKKKKQPEEPKKQKQSPVQLAVALSKLDYKDLESVLSQSQSYFPTHPMVWLKDLVSYLNIQLENTIEQDPAYKGKSVGFPLDAVPSNCANVLHSFMKKFSQQTLDSIFLYGIQTMLQESAKGIPVHGFKLFLQLLSYTKPDIVVDKLPQYLELLKLHHNNPSKCLSILWALGQCGYKNVNCGLKVWLDLMLPALEVRQVAHYPVEYLETLIKSNKTTKKSYGIVTLREYFQVLDVFFTPQFTLANDLRKRLTVCYPFIKKLAYGEEPSHNLRTFFPSYLTRYTSTNSQPLKHELLECMTHCLITDKQSYSVWCQLYTKHLVASSHLLEHIDHNWGKLSSKFDKKVLMETLRSFSVTNEELELQSKGKLNGLKLCQATTKDLRLKLTGTHFPWSLLVFFLVSVFAAIVVYDITSSPSFRLSKTMQFLEHYGILSLLENTYQCINNVVTLSINWLKVNFPIFYTSVRDTVVPFMILVWETSRNFVINAEVVSRPYRDLMVVKAVQLYNWVYELSPEFWVRCGELSWLAWEILKDYSFRIWKHMVLYAGEAEHWLTEHVLTGSFSKQTIKDTAIWGVENVQNYTSFVVSWTKAYFLTTK